MRKGFTGVLYYIWKQRDQRPNVGGVSIQQ